MFILAIDQSTSHGSLALLNDETVITEQEWREANHRGQHVFSILPIFFKHAAVDVSQIEMFAVGLGPGAFSGLRISLSMVRGLALPGDVRIFGVSSAEALVWDIVNENGGRGSVTVLGDARRDRVWLAVFEKSGDSLGMTVPFMLVKWDDLASRIEQRTTVVTADWNTIGERLGNVLPEQAEMIRQARVPKARTVGQLALRRLRNGQQSEPLVPIYLHPPVFVEPRFSEAGRVGGQHSGT